MRTAGPRDTSPGVNDSDAADAGDLTDLVRAARRGLRRDVAALVAALDRGELLVPLAREIDDAPEGERVEIQGELKLSPHLLVDEDGQHFAALFTRPDLLAPLAETVGWTTEGAPLKFCTVPARMAFDMALQVVDEKQVMALIINAGSDSELFLRRDELASINHGRPLPLVGYVRHIPEQEDERTLIAEPADPPPPALLEALTRCVAENPVIERHSLRRTFNADRDLEPHLTLTLATKPDVDARALAERVFQALSEHLPPPGYIDIVFEDA